MTSRNYCFTINNPTVPLEWDLEPISYCVWQTEQGENGTPHYQGYLELSKPIRFSALKKLSDQWARGHFEPRRATQAAAIAYAQKLDTRIEGDHGEQGEKSKQGSKRGRSEDLALLNRLIGAGANSNDIAIEMPDTYHSYSRTIEKLEVAHLSRRKRDCKPNVYVIFGPPGTNKSRSVYDTEPDLYVRPAGDGHWWEGYTGQQAILLDDLRDVDYPFHQLLRILDRFNTTVPKRNQRGGEPLMAKRIYITCPNPPDLWYPRIEEHRDQLYRRISQIISIDTVTPALMRLLFEEPNEPNVYAHQVAAAAVV